MFNFTNLYSIRFKVCKVMSYFLLDIVAVYKAIIRFYYHTPSTLALLFGSTRVCFVFFNVSRLIYMAISQQNGCRWTEMAEAKT